MVVRFFHEKKEEDKAHRAPDSAPVLLQSAQWTRTWTNLTNRHPSPALAVIDEACKHRGNIIATGQEEGVQCYVGTALMGEVLKGALVDLKM